MIILEHIFSHTTLIVFHSIMLTVAAVCVAIAIRIERKNARKQIKLKSIKPGDQVKFYSKCKRGKCILNGTVIRITDPVIEIKPDKSICYFDSTNRCSYESAVINKHYRDIIL